MNKGFVSVAAIALIGVVSVVVAGGGYGAYKYKQVAQEKREIEQQLIEQKDREIAELKEQVAEQSAQGSEEATSTDKEKEEGEEAIESGDVSTSETQSNTQIAAEPTSYVPPSVTQPSASQPVVEEEPTVEEEPGSEEEEPALEILDTDYESIGDSMEVSWSTNKKSDSRMILDDDIYVSDERDSTEHSVLIGGLPKSNVYSYEIIATAGSEEVSYFDKFSTPREFVVDFELSDEECFYVIVEDTAGNPLVNTTIQISGHVENESIGNIRSDTVREETDLEGKVEYCENIDWIEVENVATGEMYYEGY